MKSEVYNIEPNGIYCGDCLELMPHIADKSVDMILCDLPYGTTACAWDSVIPLDKLWEQYRRICKQNAAIVLFGSEPFSTHIRMSALDLYKYDWIWVKNHATGFQHAKNMPMKDFETISVFSKGSMGHANLLGDKRMTYNPQGTKACHIEYHNAKAKFGVTVGARPSHKDHIVTEECNYPRTTLFFDKDTDNFHPTQKPVDLLRYLVLTYTNENNVVLDNTMGSGSTIVAAIRENRQYIGIEKDEHYFEIAKKRIKNETSQLSLF